MFQLCSISSLLFFYSFRYCLCFRCCAILFFSLLFNCSLLFNDTGDKLPWSVTMDNFSVYTVHKSNTVHHLLKPSSLCATVAVTTKYRFPAADCLSLLGLCIHGDMQYVEVFLVAQQVRFLWYFVDLFELLYLL